MTATTTTSSRNASKRRTGQPRTVPPTVVDVCTSGLPLDEDIADVVQRVGKFDAIESGHADALRTLTERTDHALSEYVRLARAWKAAGARSVRSRTRSVRVTRTHTVVSCLPVSCGMHTRRCPTWGEPLPLPPVGQRLQRD